MDAEDAPHAPHFGASLVDMLDVMAVGRVGALFYKSEWRQYIILESLEFGGR